MKALIQIERAATINALLSLKKAVSLKKSCHQSYHQFLL